MGQPAPTVTISHTAVCCPRCGKPIWAFGWPATAVDLRTCLPNATTPAWVGGPDAWECPRCHVIHAWWVSRCPCPPPTRTVITTGGTG